ncbi:MAG: ubiquinone/menaquinone biosynthesis methyltransferase [Armatimonadota bacterium]
MTTDRKSSASDPIAIRDMFSAIAPRYDLLNHLLSLGADRRWRRRGCELAAPEPGGNVLDVCAGTGDFAFACLAEHPGIGRVCLTDFAEPMLSLAQAKANGIASGKIACGCADALRLPYADESFDLVLCAFGVRNLADVSAGLAELWRVTRPGGELVVLEFCRRRLPWYAWPGRLWLRCVVPVVGRLLSRHESAYLYLPSSRDAFFSPEELGRELESAGYQDVRFELLTFGVATVFVARR